MVKLSILVLITTIVCICEGKNILFFNGFASHSHLVAFEPLAKKLADVGHNVTILSTQFSEEKHPKITHYCPKSVLELQDEMNDVGIYVLLSRIESKYNDFFLDTQELWDGQTEICNRFYSNPEFQAWMKVSTFDLVITDTFSRECSLPIAHIFGAKSIIFSPATIFYGEPDSFGYSPESSWNTAWRVDTSVPESLYLEYIHVTWYLWRQMTYLPRFDALVQSVFKDPSIPTLREMEMQVSLFFVNNHYAYEQPRSYPPFVVPVGGMHCKTSKGISDSKIREFVEDPESDGFIYMSYGSFVQISALPTEYLNIYFEAMLQFPKIKFLWKWEGEFPKNTPKNVLMSKWFKQQDILAHPKCRGFITQGGLMSFQQAVFHGVPVIIMPAGADQILNARTAQKVGMGLHYEFSELKNNQSLYLVIRELLHNPKYTVKVKELSKLSKDRPMSALDTALWWTEYVLRQDDLSHLKSPGMYQSWWQRRLLHIWALLFFIIFVIVSTLLSIIYFSLKFILRKSLKDSSRSVAPSKKNK